MSFLGIETEQVKMEFFYKPGNFRGNGGCEDELEVMEKLPVTKLLVVNFLKTITTKFMVITYYLLSALYALSSYYPYNNPVSKNYYPL